MIGAAAPSTRSVLSGLTKARLLDLGRRCGVATPKRHTKAQHCEALVRSRQLRFDSLLKVLSRDELKALCRTYGLDDEGRARVVLAERLLTAHGPKSSQPPRPHFEDGEGSRYTPRARDIVHVRHRQYLVEAVIPPPEPGHGTLVELVCLDDDHQGGRLHVLWELELGARILHSDQRPLPTVDGLDSPRRFAAYLHALKWNSVTATDAKLFQAPFRAGIKLMSHQLIPLKKALALPRANLFIADDVGLGKTIEAGLVLQELLLRQQVDFVLIVAPASVCLQWRDEMRTRFGLRFEVYNRAFMARRRQERGFGVNPWSTHNRFIISYQTLRRPEYRERLLDVLGERAKKSLLILDEAHTAAPSSGSRYAIDSRTTKVIRDVAPRFENRLFLSATPHNGHSNSFSALLEILDPQRFTRGVPVSDVGRLDAVMVRRLKSDLRALAALGTLAVDYPERKVVRLDLEFERGWHLRHPDAADQARRLDAARLHAGAASDALAPELELSRQLREYTALMSPKPGRGRLVLVNLQKRLLSSIYAFWRTLQAHAAAVDTHDLHGRLASTDFADRAAAGEADEYGPDDEALDQADERATRSGSVELADPGPKARALLQGMLELARVHRQRPDAKVLALLDWMAEHQCEGLRPSARRRGAGWTSRRVLLFTEYGDTKSYVKAQLEAAIEETHRGEERLMVFHGGMSDEQREDVQRAFRGNPAEHPVRILLCTDAAREGLNLHEHCQDLFHLDVPWNPARMEQRNGRIDRTGQPAKEVRCHYFHYAQRSEDLVLRKVVEKVDVIQRELGSLGTVVLEQVDRVLAEGITEQTPKALDQVGIDPDARATASEELERVRTGADADKPIKPDPHSRAARRLAKDIEDAKKILSDSRRVMEFRPALLRDAVEVGLELAGAGPLEPLEDAEAFRLPELGEAWQETLDHLRPPRHRDESFWDWRRRPPRPIAFHPERGDEEGLVQLHLSHPFIKRLLSRFVAQGYGAHDLHRVTLIPNPYDALTRVVAFARLSLFGPGATRLHDQLVSVAADWLTPDADRRLRPISGPKADHEVRAQLDTLLAETGHAGRRRAPAIPDGLAATFQQHAAADFAELWTHVRDEADSLAHDAGQRLAERGAQEARDLEAILDAQRAAIPKFQARRRAQLAEAASAAERTQLEQDLKAMQRRLEALEKERRVEPAEIEARYRVHLQRLAPVGLIYLVPTSMLGA